MLGNNQGTLVLIKNTYLNERSKYINICYYFIHDLIEKGELRVDYIPIAKIVANSITKPLIRVIFKRFKNQIGLAIELKIR